MLSVYRLCFFQALSLAVINASQQSVHLTLGILRQSQAVSHALAFFWLDGFAVPAPARVTQTDIPCLACDTIQGSRNSIWAYPTLSFALIQILICILAHFLMRCL